MSRLCNRVKALETDQGTDAGIERMWAVVGVRASLFKQAVRSYANSNLNAFEDMHRNAPEIPDVSLNKIESVRIAEDAAEFRRRIAAIRSRN